MFTDKGFLPKEPGEIVRPASVAAKLPSWLAGADLMEQDWGRPLSHPVSFPIRIPKAQAAPGQRPTLPAPLDATPASQA